MNRSIKDLGNFILRKKIYILLITVIFMVTGVAYTFSNAKYVASQKILIEGENIGLMDTYQEIIKGSATLEQVIQNLNLTMNAQELVESVEVSVVEHTDMLEIKVCGLEEEQVQNISNEITKVFHQTVEQIYGSANFYEVDKSGNYYTNGNGAIVGISLGLVGFVLSCFIFVVGWILDTRIKTSKDIEEITGLKSLISIPKIKMIEKKKLNIKNMRTHKSEAFKTLMTNIQFVNLNHLESKSILVTSPNALAGKTYVATNLAIEFAKAGKKVILIDGDMRRGRIAKIFDLPNELGFSNYLSNLDSNGNHINERITHFINDTEIKNLNVITAGNVPPNPNELLATEKIDELLKELKIFYDIILLDTISLLEAAEADQLSRKCDLTLALSAYGKTKKEELLKAYQQVNEKNQGYLGMGFNQVPDIKLKKKIINFKNNARKSINKFFKEAKVFLKKTKEFAKKFSKLKDYLKKVGIVILSGLIVAKKQIIHLLHCLKSKSQEVREYIQKRKNKKDAVKLIASGNVAKGEKNSERREALEEQDEKLATDELEYRKKLDYLKSNIELKNEAEVPKVRPVVTNIQTHSKSKFDLMREQQKKEEQKIEIIDADEKEGKKEETKSVQELIKLEPKNKPDELKQETEKIKQEKISQYKEIELAKQKHITEEMIRKQVEMDEMIRLAEKEEEEENLQLQKITKDAKMKRKNEYMEKLRNFLAPVKDKKEVSNITYLEEERIRKMENKIEEKIKKESEKSENRARIEKARLEKKAYREMEKQRQKEELRIEEELQEDNLYPKPRI